MRRSAVIVIERAGKTIVLTGWRAWLVAIVVAIATAAFALVLLSLWLGIVITLGLILLIAVPIAVVLGLIASWIGLIRFN